MKKKCCNAKATCLPHCAGHWAQDCTALESQAEKMKAAHEAQAPSEKHNFKKSQELDALIHQAVEAQSKKKLEQSRGVVGAAGVGPSSFSVPLENLVHPATDPPHMTWTSAAAVPRPTPTCRWRTETWGGCVSWRRTMPRTGRPWLPT